MSTNDLLKPRYKVMIKAPNCFKVGTIIEKHKYASGNWYVPNCMYDPDDYPEVFKKLEWWEERQIEDMPEYVKIQRFYEHIPCAVYKVGAEVEWNYIDDCLIGIKFISGGGTMPNYILPATATEYEQYINQKEKQ